MPARACRSASFVHGDLTSLELERGLARRGLRVLRAEPRAARAAAGALRARAHLAAPRRALPRDARRERPGGLAGRVARGADVLLRLRPVAQPRAARVVRARRRRGRRRSRSPRATCPSTGCSRSDDAATSRSTHYRELLQAARGRRLSLGGLRPRAAGGRPDPAPRRRPLARRRARDGRGRGVGGRVVDVVPDDALGLLQPRARARASARSRACASSATGSRTTRSIRTSISTTASTASSRGTTPTRST